MVKSFLYAIVAAGLVVLFGYFFRLAWMAIDNGFVFVVLLILLGLESAFVGYKAKVLLNIRLGKYAPSGLFFGLLMYIVTAVMRSFIESGAGDGLHVQLLPMEGAFLLIGALIAGKKAA